MSVEQFVPAPADQGPITRAVVEMLRPDLTVEQVDRSWAEFDGWRGRVNSPVRRRNRAFAKIDGSAVLFRPPLPA